MCRQFYAALLLLALSPQLGMALADPTQPAAYRAAANKEQATLQLESILYSTARTVAVINGTVVAEGESVGGAKVITISKEGVTLSSEGKVIKLVLQRPSIRREQ